MERQDGMSSRSDVARDFVEVELHHVGVGIGQGKGRAAVVRCWLITAQASAENCASADNLPTQSLVVAPPCNTRTTTTTDNNTGASHCAGVHHQRPRP